MIPFKNIHMRFFYYYHNGKKQNTFTEDLFTVIV